MRFALSIRGSSISDQEQEAKGSAAEARDERQAG
jgi:hypothetical protein